MRYAIISVDESRAANKARIRHELTDLQELEVAVVDARPESVDLEAELAARGLHFADYWKGFLWQRGDIGGFLSHFAAWELAAAMDEPLLVLEDDALVPEGFQTNVETMLAEVPDRFGAVSLCVHEQELAFYGLSISYDAWGLPVVITGCAYNPHDYGADHMALAYQNWVLTAAVYSPQGGRRLVECAREMGVHMNADAFVWHRAHAGDFAAYAPKPEFAGLGASFFTGQSLIQGTTRDRMGF